MTPEQEAEWLRVQERARRLRPDIAAALLAASEVIRDNLSDAALAELISLGAIDALLDAVITVELLAEAFAPLQDAVRIGLGDAIRFFGQQLPTEAQPIIRGGIGFDILNPLMLQGVRDLEGKVMTTLEANIRETVRAYVENGLRDGVGPVDIARGLKDVIGLAPNQLEAVNNFRTMLQNGDREALTRTLRDARYDPTLNRLLGANKAGLSPAQIEKMVEAYRANMKAFNAETNARTIALQAQKEGNRLAQAEAIARGALDGDTRVKTWSGVMDDRERAEHVTMEGETVGWDALYSNGNDVPGDDTYNCRCISLYSTEYPTPDPNA